MIQKTLQEQLNDLDSRIEGSSIETELGIEIGTAKKVRAGRSFQIFAKEIEKSKSGKAILATVKIFIEEKGKIIGFVRGNTYLPNFVIEKKDPYWILENKVYNYLGSVKNGNISIDHQYVPDQHRKRIEYWSQDYELTPQGYVEQSVNSLKMIRGWIAEDLKLEKAILGFMEMIA